MEKRSKKFLPEIENANDAASILTKRIAENNAIQEGEVIEVEPLIKHFTCIRCFQKYTFYVTPEHDETKCKNLPYQVSCQTPNCSTLYQMNVKLPPNFPMGISIDMKKTPGEQIEINFEGPLK